MARSSKRLIIKTTEQSYSQAALPKSKTRETPTQSAMHSRYNSFLASSQPSKHSPQPQPLPRKSSPYSQAIELSKSRSVSALKLKELKKNPTPEKLRKDYSYKKLTDKTLPASKATPLKPRKRSEPKLASVSYTDSHSIPTSLNSSSALATNLSLSFNNSFNTSIGGVLKSPKASKKDKLIHTSEAMLLESQLTERLAAVKPTEEMSSDKFKIYQKMFEEVINRDERFGSLLTKIKLAYEDWHYSEGKPTLTERLKAELNEKVEELIRIKQEHTQLSKKVSKLAKENVELSRSLEDSEARYLDLQDRLLKLTQVKCDSVPRDESSWQYLVSENKYYSEVFKNLKRDMKYLKHREDKLLKLIYALKKHGYPVEQVYKEECRKTKQSKLPYKEVKGSNAGDEEVEPLVYGPPKAVERPKVVPVLCLTEVEPDLTSESDTGTEYTESVASSASSTTQKSQAKIPKLCLSKGQEQGFHEEFMSKMDEFSESWRKQIEQERR
mmetsp:Transcript_2730/g.6036  ORF Transcript_2730/g.6036 Transcript_2730/m.6036 type:complete len:497 (+) Transcript_2730:47-1537(+)